MSLGLSLVMGIVVVTLAFWGCVIVVLMGTAEPISVVDAFDEGMEP